MASNSFGSIVRVTTWGESHGKGIGCVLDGFPSNIPLNEEDINLKLARRSPGRSHLTSPRAEEDKVQILSGVFEGKTTAAPIALWIENRTYDSSPYHETKHILRPGHVSFTYSQKYGHWDYRGGGRASARETAARVAAGACVEKWLSQYGIRVTAWLSQVGGVSLSKEWEERNDVASCCNSSPRGIFCPDPEVEMAFCSLLESLVVEGDSVGGVVTCRIDGVPSGIGEPIYNKLEACLAHSMMGLPASKGFEIGEGFHASSMRGSQYIDGFIKDPVTGKIIPSSNRAGGILGGISTGESIVFRVAFKPASSIRIPIPSVDAHGDECMYETPKRGKHDPCVAIRAVPVVEAMAYCTIGDLIAQSNSLK